MHFDTLKKILYLFSSFLQNEKRKTEKKLVMLKHSMVHV